MRPLVTGLAIVLAAALVGCCKPVPTPDPKTDIELCPAACEHMAVLGCEEGNPIAMPDGTAVSCSQFCVDTANSGHWLNPRCLATLQSCNAQEIEACGVHEQ